MSQLMLGLVIAIFTFCAVFCILHLILGVFAYMVGAESSLKRAIKKSFTEF